MKKRSIVGTLIFLAMAMVFSASAAGPKVPYVFQAGQPATAEQVNENFQELSNRIGSAIDMTKYWPPPGLVRTYSDKEFWTMSGEPPSEKEFTETLIGNESTRTYADGSSEVTVYTNSLQGLEVAERKFYDSQGAMQEEHVFDPPETCLWPSGKKKIGESWGNASEYTRDYYSDGLPGRSWGVRQNVWTILGVEVVSVPAGTFSGCVKIQNQRDNDIDGLYWLAEGIGIVKFAQGTSHYGRIRELKSFQQP